MTDLRTIPNVELVTTGTWDASTGTITFTEEMLAAAVAAVDDPAVRSPVLKLGHDGPLSTDQPTIGRFVNLRLSADRQSIIADLTGVPGWLADILPTAYPSRSIEANIGVRTATGSTHDMVITAVSMLGIAEPAVETLADLQALYSDVMPEFVEAGQAVRASKGGPMSRSVQASVDTEDLRAAFYGSLDSDRKWWWIRTIYLDPPTLIVDDDEGGLWRIPWSTAGDAFEFGEPEQVRVEYVAATAQPPRGGILASYTSRAEARPDEGSVMDPEKIRERLGLPADASDDDVLARLDELQGAAQPPTEEASAVEEPAEVAASGRDGSVVTVDRETWEQVRASAEQGREAAERLQREDREAKVEAAVRDGRISPARRDAWLKRLAADPAEAEVLASLEPGLIPVSEIGGIPDPAAASEDAEMAVIRAALGLPTRKDG